MKPSTNIQTPSDLVPVYCKPWRTIVFVPAKSKDALLAHAPSPSPVPTDEALPLGWEGDLLDDACKELDRALKSNSLPALADQNKTALALIDDFFASDLSHVDPVPLNAQKQIMSWLRRHILDGTSSPAILGGSPSTTPPAAQVPDGWQLVPKEPTVEMLVKVLPLCGAPEDVATNRLAKQAIDHMIQSKTPPSDINKALFVARGLISDYRTMLTAAPPQGSEM